MASIDKKSVRNQVSNLKSDFERLCQEGKVTEEVATVVNGLIMILEMLVAIFMERKTRKTSKNSSIPSSQTDKDNSSKNESKCSNGKGKTEKDKKAFNTRTIETVKEIKVTTCSYCGELLKDVPCSCVERRTIIDIVFEKVIKHVDAEIKECPNCNKEVKGQHPDDMPGPIQYGKGIQSYVINLLICQMISLNRVQKELKTIIGTIISETTLLGYLMRLYIALESWEIQEREKILQMSCINVDETSCRVKKKNYWIHVYSSGEITLKFLHRKRGREAIEDIDIIPKYSGVMVHDCWSAYLSYSNCSHALCGSHLLRELTFTIEVHQYRWAINIKNLLREINQKVSKSEDKCLTDKEYANLQKRYRNIITRGEKELPEIPSKQKGKKGKLAKSDAHNLFERLKKYETAVLLFAKNPYVSFTNNRAERDIRMGKVKQKISGCFRSEKFAKAYCRISSYLITMANKGYNPLIAIQMALNGNIPK